MPSVWRLRTSSLEPSSPDRPFPKRFSRDRVVPRGIACAVGAWLFWQSPPARSERPPLVGEAASVRFGEPRHGEPAAHYLRPALEIGAALAAASVWYYLDKRNVLDWDYPSAKERFNPRAWRFDNNPFAVNHFWHPLSGSGMYVLARGNRLGVWPSFLYALGGSTTWEYVIEFNEKISIGDMIVTPLAGFSAGEFFHKLALHLSDGGVRTAGQEALAWSMGLSVYGHRKLDGDVVPGHGSDTWRELSFRYGFGLTEREDAGARAVQILGFDGSFVSIEGFRKASSFNRWFHDAEIASLSVQVDLSSKSPGIDAFSETLVAGYCAQNLRLGHGFASGGWAIAAMGLAYHYRSTEAFGFDDRQAQALFPGLAGELGFRRGGFRSLARLRVYPSFGGVSAPSYAFWRRREPTVRTKTVLQQEGYFFGWGLLGQIEARVGLRSVELRGELGYSRFESIEGLDRSQERVAADPHGIEIALSYGLSAWAAELPVPLSFGAAIEGSARTSRMPGVERQVGGRRLMLKIVAPL